MQLLHAQLLHWNYMCVCMMYILAEILREIEKNKFVKPTPIQVSLMDMSINNCVL